MLQEAHHYDNVLAFVRNWRLRTEQGAYSMSKIDANSAPAHRVYALLGHQDPTLPHNRSANAQDLVGVLDLRVQAVT